jgi:hypothetical protein
MAGDGVVKGTGRSREEWFSLLDERGAAGRGYRDSARRVSVGFTAKGPSKTVVAVAHERLPDEATAQAVKARWKERLGALAWYAEA